MTLNPIFWLHARINGRKRSMVLIPVIYAGVVILFATLSFRVADAKRDYPQLYSTWLMFMTAAQGLFLLIVAPSLIRRSVQRDFDSGMMESHRLSPMSNLRIVLGYLTGAPMQALLLCGVSALLGSYFATQLGMLPGMGGRIGLGVTMLGWGTALASMLVLSAAVCAAVLLVAIATGGKTNVGLLILVGVFGGWFAVLFVPGLALLTGVFSGGTVFNLLTKPTATGNPAVIFSAAALQFVYFLIFVAACCGKLRHPERALLSLRLGTILLVTWGLTLVAGMAVVGSFSGMFPPLEDIGWAQVLASTAAFMLVALLPLIAAATDARAADTASAINRTRSGRATVLRLVPFLLALTTVGCMLLMRLFVVRWLAKLPPVELAAGLIASLVASALFFWTAFCFCYSLAALSIRMRVWVPLVVGAQLAGPLALESLARFVVHEMGNGHWPDAGYLAAMSPIGTFWTASYGSLVACGIGLVVQAAGAAIATVWARRIRRGLSLLSVPRARAIG